MRESPKVQKWVVYETVTGLHIGMKSVCTASEWLAIEARDPGRNRVIKEDITDENEAEKLARGTSGDLKTRPKTPRPSFH